MQIAKKIIWTAVAACLPYALAANAQTVADPGFKSVGRGAPLAADLGKPPAQPKKVQTVDDPAVKAFLERDPWTVGPVGQRAGRPGGPGAGGPPVGGAPPPGAPPAAGAPPGAPLPPRSCFTVSSMARPLVCALKTGHLPRVRLSFTSLM